MADGDFYTQGSYKKPATVYGKLTLHSACPADGALTYSGVAVANKPDSKAANLFGWPSVLRAATWAAGHSEAFRLDLLVIAAEHTKEADKRREFERGYACAVAMMLRHNGPESCLSCAGLLDAARIEQLGLDDFDLEVLRPFVQSHQACVEVPRV